MKINIYLAFTLAFVFMILLPTILVFTLKSKPKSLKFISIVMFVFYLCALFLGTLTWFNMNGQTVILTLNLSTGEWFSSYFIWYGLGKLNILINLAMFLPVGFFVFTLTNKHPFLKTILLSLSLSLLIEFLQFALPIYRNTEVLDIVLNTLSGLISATYCLILSKLSKNTIFKQ